jgi:exonuclease-1
LSKNNIDAMVAIYEADSQLAYLNKIGIADLVITSDSDAVCHGIEKVVINLNRLKSTFYNSKSLV